MKIKENDNSKILMVKNLSSLLQLSVSFDFLPLYRCFRSTIVVIITFIRQLLIGDCYFSFITVKSVKVIIRISLPILVILCSLMQL